VALCFFLNGLLYGNWVSRIPDFKARMGLASGPFGLVLLCMGLGAICVMPLAGRWASRVGSHRVTSLCAVLYCVLFPLLPVAPNAPLLSALLFVFGAAGGAMDVAMNAQAVEVEARYTRPIMSSFHGIWSVGGLSGAAIGGLIAGAGVPSLPHFAGMALLAGGPACLVALPRLLSSAPVAPASPGPHFRLPSRRLAALGAIAFCVMMGEGAMADWSALFLREYARASEAVAAAGYAAFSLAMASGRFGGDYVTARLGPRRLLRLSGALAAGALLLALVTARSTFALPAFALVGAGFATVIPLVFSAAGRVDERDPGTSLAIVTTLGYSGFLLGPPLIGFLAELLGLRLALGLTVVTNLLFTLLAPSVGRRAVPGRPGAASGPALPEL
jgi:MFS family permease